MSSGYPMDEFDRAGRDMPSGVHRPRQSPWRFVLPTVVILVLVALLAWGVVHFMNMSGGSHSQDQTRQSSSTSQSKRPGVNKSQSRTAEQPKERTQSKPGASGQSKPQEAPKEPEAKKHVDKNAKIVVLNGTGQSGLAAQKATQLKNEGYPGVSADNAVGWDTTVPVVYYSDPDLKATAEELARLLGVTKVEKDEKTVFPGDADIAVILR